MAKMTKKQFEAFFRESILPHVIASERPGHPDKPARRQAWNDTINSYIRDQMLSESAGNWGHPRWLETYRPRSVHHAMKKSPMQLDREIAESLAKEAGFKIGDVVQFRFEPGTGGVIRYFFSGLDGRNWAQVATSRGERKVPTDAIAHVRKEHEARVRRSVQ